MFDVVMKIDFCELEKKKNSNYVSFSWSFHVINTKEKKKTQRSLETDPMQSLENLRFSSSLVVLSKFRI